MFLRELKNDCPKASFCLFETKPMLIFSELSQLIPFRVKLAPALIKPVMVMLLLDPPVQFGEELANEKLSLKSAPYTHTRFAVESFFMDERVGFTSPFPIVKTLSSRVKNMEGAKIGNFQESLFRCMQIWTTVCGE
jgi:hypothetical protein